MSRTISDDARIRLAWMDSYRECGNAARVCRHFSIPLRTFWRWRRRYDPFDLASLECRRRGPKRPPARTPWEVERRVLALKREHPRWGRRKLALVLSREGAAPCGRTCGRILVRHGRSFRYRTRKRRAPKPRVRAAEMRLPGDLLQVDTKYVALGSRRLFQYTAVDVVSRWRHAEIHPELDSATAAAFLGSAAASAPFRVAAVQTDNGREFGRAFSRRASALGARHFFTHKARPTENGRVERSHRTDEEEFWSVGGHGATVADLRSSFSAYIAMYNNERPHWALGGKTPIEALAAYSTK
ncbi:MAG: integrase core domain-containing protein [bacterium]